MADDELKIAGTLIQPGERRTVDVPLPRLYTHGELAMPVQVIRGPKDGPRLLLSAVVHGDELNGIEIIRRVLASVEVDGLRGTIVAVPVVNVYGLINQSRYLPDRRDLNRSFPGSARGSLAARLAYLFLNQVAGPCTHAIDLHTASANRINLPQVRADLTDPVTRACALAFGAPIALHAATRDGSFREAAGKRGLTTLLYEAGEPLRFNEDAISAGVRGIRRVMRHLKMMPNRKTRAGKAGPVIEVRRSTWIRARRSGVLRLHVQLGETLSPGQILGVISDPMDESRTRLRSTGSGVVIGHAINPLVHRGDAVVHVGVADGPKLDPN
jgi:hypothetical protein